jgi:sulfonate transport system permease protein
MLPSPEKTVETFRQLLANGDIAINVKASLLLVLKGFVIGTLMGLVLGSLMGLSRTFEKLIGPTFHAIRQVPLLGWIPLIVLWFGVGSQSKVVFISIGAAYAVALNTCEGIKGVPQHYKEIAQVFDYSKLRLFLKVILPAALPSILTGIRVGLGVIWALLVAAEVLTTTSAGIGTMISEGRENFRMDIAVVGIIVIGAIGLAMNQSVTFLERHLLRWRRTL